MTSRSSGPWWPEPCVLLDVETTGLSAENDRVIEIACVVSVRGAVKWERRLLLDPEMPIPAEATKIHGITDDDVSGKPKFREVAHFVLARINTGIQAAYNAPFDRRFIGAEMQRAGFELGPETWLDPYPWAREQDRYKKGKKRLVDCCERRGIPIDAHSALGDCRAATALLAALQPGMPEDLGECLERQEWLREEQERDFQEWLSKQPKRTA